MGLRREKEIGVYVHVPFCVSKCPYCDFSSVAVPEAPEARYTGAVLKELSSIVDREGLKERPLSTVYLGGGTPSIFSPSTIKLLLDSIKNSFRAQRDCEITLEVNPDTVGLDKLRGFHAAGVTRLSIGFQALSEAHLKALGRTHTVEKAFSAFTDGRAAGFGNIGVDLIFGIPGQSFAQWEEAIKKVLALRPEHLSLYGLTIEESTPFHRLYAGRIGLPAEEEEAGMYSLAVRLLTEAGYRRYEVSNFALPGFESRHNTGYWKGLDYIGLGASAHSYLSYPGWGRRWWNLKDPNDYMVRAERGEPVAEGGESLTREEAIFEAAILGLRMLDKGIDGEAFRERFGAYPSEALKADELIQEGLLERRAEDLLLTHKGVVFSNEVFVRLKV